MFRHFDLLVLYPNDCRHTNASGAVPPYFMTAELSMDSADQARGHTVQRLVDHPVLLAVVTFVVMWCAAQLGARAFSSMRKLEPDERNDLGFVVGATLTLLGLLIGFSFSMAVGRYDQRKGYEEEEANAIGTEYLRVELLAPADAER